MRVSDNESVPVVRYVIAQVRSLTAILSREHRYLLACVRFSSTTTMSRKKKRLPTARLRLEVFSQNRVRQLSRIPRPRHDLVPPPFLLYDGTTKTRSHVYTTNTHASASAHPRKCTVRAVYNGPRAVFHCPLMVKVSCRKRPAG